jgi:DNA-binding response OmpR family regulator
MDKIINKNYNILIVDDEEEMLDSLCFQVKRENYNVLSATSGKQAIEIVKSQDVDIVVLDYILDDINADKVVKKIRTFNNKVYIIINTAHIEDFETIDTFQHLQIQGFRYKCEEPKTLLYWLEAGKRVHQQIDSLLNTSKKSFGSRLKEGREKIGKKQEEIASYLGLTRQAIGSWENDIRYPDIANLKKLCILYGVTSDYLLEGIQV